MHRIDTSTAQKDKFGAGKDGFTSGNPQTGVPATEVSAAILDSWQEELCAVVEGAGGKLEKGNNSQLLMAIQKLSSSRYFHSGQPLPVSNMGPIWHDDYVSIMTWQSFTANGANYQGYASQLIGNLLLDTQPIPRLGYIKSGVQNLDRTTYAALRAWAMHNGIMVAPGVWKAGTIQCADNADGATFRIFDVRGEFLRAVDDGRGVDPSRAFGSNQLGTIVTADPTAELPGISSTIGDGNYSKQEFLRRMSADPVSKSDYAGVLISNIASNPGVDLDALNNSYGATRPNNTALLASIKF